MASEWTAATIGDAFELVTGYAFKSSDFIERGVPVIKIKNVKAGEFSEHEFSYVSESFLNVQHDKLAQFGDLLISMSGNRIDGSPATWVGKVAQFRKENRHFINQRVGALRLRHKASMDERFASYLLSSRVYQELFIAVATSSGGQANLSPAQILGAPMRYPDLASQRAIAHILGALDDKIELNRRASETLEAMARALFKSWFVDFDPTRAKLDGCWHRGQSLPGLPARFYDIFPSRLVDSGLGEIPEGWRLTTLGNEVVTVLGGTPSRAESAFWGGDIPWINSGKANEFRIVEPSEFITHEGLASSATKLLPSRTTVIAITGATLGQISLTEIETCANQSIVGVLGDGTLPSEFIYFWTRERVGDLLASQTGGAQQHINKNNVNDLPVLCPPEPVINAYIAVVRATFDRIKMCCNESRNLGALRDTLLPKLISGELRVNDAEKLARSAA